MADSLFTATPGTVNADDGQPINTGTSFTVTTAVTCTHHRFYAPTSGAGTVTARLYRYVDEENTPELLAEKAYSSVSAGAYNSVAWDTPIELEVGQYYLTQHHASGGHYVATGSAFGSDVPSAGGLLTAIANGSSTAVGTLRNGKFKYGALAFADQNGASTNFFDDVIVEEPDTTVNLDGSDAATSTSTGALRVTVRLSGSDAATATSAGAARIAVMLAALDAALSASTGAARVTVRLAGSDAASSGASASLQGASAGRPLVTVTIGTALTTITRG